jgi:hypothetical protein
MEVNVELWSLDTFDPDSAMEDRQYISQGEEPGRPSFTGISLAEVDRIVKMVQEVGLDGMTQRQQLISMLATQSQLRIFRAWPDGASKQLDTYRNWLQCAFMACGFFGYEWFYKLQMDHELDSVDVDYSALKPPRWLATEFKVTKNDKGELLSVEPYKVQAFSPKQSAIKGSQMLPTTEVRVFEYCAAVDRNQSRQSAVLKYFMRSNEFKIKGKLKKHPDVQGKYIVGLHPTTDGRVLTADHGYKPEPRTRTRMFIKAPGGGDQQNYHRFNGIVVEDQFGSNAELTLLVEGPELDFDKRTPPSGFAKDEYLVPLSSLTTRPHLCDGRLPFMRPTRVKRIVKRALT